LGRRRRWGEDENRKQSVKVNVESERKIGEKIEGREWAPFSGATQGNRD
jgi:hypothetical protein